MKIHVTHSSTACVLLEIGPVRILTDPVLDVKTETYPFVPFPLSLVFNATRSAGPQLALTELPPHKPLDLVLLSHAHHGDNLDHAGEAILHHAGEVITSVRGKNHLRYKLPATGLKPWATTTHFAECGAQIRITSTPAHHRPRWLPEGHEVVGFLIEWDAQPGLLEAQENGAIYISGDTVYFAGIAEIPLRFQRRIGTALLHLGAVDFDLPLGRFTFDGPEAARTAVELRVHQVIPIHYEQKVWSHLKPEREAYVEDFARAGVSNVTWLTPGERTPIVV